MSEHIKLPGGSELSVARDTSSYPDRFLVHAGQENVLESAVLSLVKKTTGMTTAEPIAKGSSLPALTPIEIDPHKLLRVTDDFEKRLAEILTDISSRVGAKLAQVGRRCLIQVGYSEALDNSENMFGDYLYIRVRLFPSR